MIQLHQMVSAKVTDFLNLHTNFWLKAATSARNIKMTSMSTIYAYNLSVFSNADESSAELANKRWGIKRSKWKTHLLFSTADFSDSFICLPLQ